MLVRMNSAASVGRTLAPAIHRAHLIKPQPCHAPRALSRLACSTGNGEHAVPWLHSLATTRPSLSRASTSSSPSSIPSDADAILILAGGQTNEGNNLPPWVERRLDTCLGLQRLQSKPCPIVCLGGGTPHKAPILKPNGFVIHESTSCASYLIGKGADPRLILKENSSYDTVGNAFFSLTIHALPAAWRNVVVVTSDFHMPRSQALFEDMFCLAARDVVQDPERFTLTFASSSDEGLFEADVLQARRDKEAASLAQWRSHEFRSKTFAQLHNWLFLTHQCYSVSRQEEFEKVTIKDPRLLASY